MEFNLAKWSKSHQILANKYLRTHNTMSSRYQLPVLPRNPLEWIKAARPQVEVITRSFLTAPFWVPIYQDNHDFIVITG